MRWAPTKLATRVGHRFRLSTPPGLRADAYPPAAAALAEEQLQGWLRIAPAGRPGQAGTDLLEDRVVHDPAGLRVAVVLREPAPAVAPGSAGQERRARRLKLTA